MKDPIEVQSPGRDRLFVVLRVEHLREPISLTPPDDVLLNISHGPAIRSLVSKWSGVRTAGSTRVVNCPIASNTD